MNMEIKSVKQYAFSGKKEDWEDWVDLFHSFTIVKGCRKIWHAKPEEIPMDSEVIDVSTTAGKDKQKLREMNEQIMGYLTLCLATNTADAKGASNLVKQKKRADTEHELGNFPRIWKLLKEKYEPVNADELEAIIDKYHNLSLKKGEEPSTMVAEADTLKVRLSSMKITKTDEEHMLHCVNRLPFKTYYECQKDIRKLYDEAKKNNTDVPTLDEALVLMQAHYRYLQKLGGKDNDNRGEEAEHALQAGHGYKKQFKGKCNKCGKWGHKASDCGKQHSNKSRFYTKGQNGGDKPKFNGNCNYCGKPGHKEFQCFKKKREEGESANTATGGEVLLTALECGYCTLDDDVTVIVDNTDQHADEWQVPDAFFDEWEQENPEIEFGTDYEDVEIDFGADDEDIDLYFETSPHENEEDIEECDEYGMACVVETTLLNVRIMF
jgi:hypothetical protein